MRTIDRLSDSFDDRNLFLQALLGLVSFCRQWAARFDHRGPTLARTTGLPGETPAAAGATVPTTTPGQEAVEDALLGLIALSRQIIAHAESARCAPETGAERHETPPRADGDPARLRGLLV